MKWNKTLILKTVNITKNNSMLYTDMIDNAYTWAVELNDYQNKEDVRPVISIYLSPRG